MKTVGLESSLKTGFGVTQEALIQNLPKFSKEEDLAKGSGLLMAHSLTSPLKSERKFEKVPLPLHYVLK